jgi:UDP-N-acetylmuramate dehydrogenase
MSLKRIELRRNHSLRNYTTIKIGGKAKSFFLAHTKEDLLQIIKSLSNSYYLLGGGSNLLVNDSCIDKPVIKLGEGFVYIKKNRDLLDVGAATPLSYLMNYCLKNNLGGLENLAGIPATIGGLVTINASSFGRAISSCLESVEVMDKKGEVKKLNANDIYFGYRTSSLKDSIVTSAWFKLENKRDLKTNINDFLQKRIGSQDFCFPSCGCIFKNPSNYNAGFLIDSCGLKGLRKNDAQVSTRHANFIINLGKAKYKDVDYLTLKIKEKIFHKFNVALEEEIERWS